MNCEKNRVDAHFAVSKLPIFPHESAVIVRTKGLNGNFINSNLTTFGTVSVIDNGKTIEPDQSSKKILNSNKLKSKTLVTRKKIPSRRLKKTSRRLKKISKLIIKKSKSIKIKKSIKTSKNSSTTLKKLIKNEVGTNNITIVDKRILRNGKGSGRNDSGVIVGLSEEDRFDDDDDFCDDDEFFEDEEVIRIARVKQQQPVETKSRISRTRSVAKSKIGSANDLSEDEEEFVPLNHVIIRVERGCGMVETEDDEEDFVPKHRRIVAIDKRPTETNVRERRRSRSVVKYSAVRSSDDESEEELLVKPKRIITVADKQPIVHNARKKRRRSIARIGSQDEFQASEEDIIVKPKRFGHSLRATNMPIKKDRRDDVQSPRKYYGANDTEKSRNLRRRKSLVFGQVIPNFHPCDFENSQGFEMIFGKSA
jgi:hypothetical protein